MGNGTLCSVVAAGRCATCYKPYCAEHQARALLDAGLYRRYTSWCLACQRKKEAEEKAAQQATRERYRKAEERLPELLAQFRARPFVGAQPRQWTEVIKRRKFFGGEQIDKIQHFDEPAVPIGKFSWMSYWADEGSDRRQSYSLETGLTAKGEFVLMDVQRIRDASHGGVRYLLYDQERWQCEALEKLLARDVSDD